MAKRELRRKVLATIATVLVMCCGLALCIWLLLTSEVFSSTIRWLMLACTVGPVSYTHLRAASGVEELSKILFEQRIFHSMAEKFFTVLVEDALFFHAFPSFRQSLPLKITGKHCTIHPYLAAVNSFGFPVFFYLYRANIWCALLFCRLSGGGL